jgi:hypothetical protein
MNYFQTLVTVTAVSIMGVCGYGTLMGAFTAVEFVLVSLVSATLAVVIFRQLRD